MRQHPTPRALELAVIGALTAELSISVRAVEVARKAFREECARFDEEQRGKNAA